MKNGQKNPVKSLGLIVVGTQQLDRITELTRLNYTGDVQEITNLLVAAKTRPPLLDLYATRVDLAMRRVEKSLASSSDGTRKNLPLLSDVV